MNWGYRILIVYVIFIVVMLGMVYVASRQTNEMQDENYYAKELVYQTVIDGKNNLNALEDTLSILNTSSDVQVKIPPAAAVNVTEGTIYFLCPSDQKSDRREKFIPDATGLQSFPKSAFKKAHYSVQVSWKSNGKPYFSEKNFYAE